jgi:6-phosphofructokinase
MEGARRIDGQVVSYTDAAMAALQAGCDLVLLCTQRREQDDVADAGLSVSSIIEAVDADAAAAGGRHAVFERAHEVVVEEHGFVVAAVLGVDLGLEARGLVFGVVQLAETVAELAPGDVELEALGHLGRSSLARASG